MKHKKKLTHAQFAIGNKELRDTARTDGWLKQNGLNAAVFTEVCSEVLIAQKKANELLKQYPKLFSPEQLEQLKKFEERVSDKKKRKKLKPSSAYPILNICTKVFRQAYRNEMIARQKIQQLRSQQ